MEQCYANELHETERVRRTTRGSGPIDASMAMRIGALEPPRSSCLLGLPVKHCRQLPTVALLLVRAHGKLLLGSRTAKVKHDLRALSRRGKNRPSAHCLGQLRAFCRQQYLPRENIRRSSKEHDVAGSAASKAAQS